MDKRGIRPGLAALTLMLLSSCATVRVQLPEEGGRAGWFLPGGSLQHENVAEKGLKPPLQLRRVLKLNAAPAAHLAYLDSVLFIPTRHGRIYAFHMGRQKMIGKVKLPDNAEGQIAIHPQGYLIITLKLGHETLQCYDLRLGGFRWKKRVGLVFSSPVPADSSIYVVSKFRHADRYDLRTGRRIWQFSFTGQSYTTPALSSNLLIFATDKGRVFALKRSNGEKVWEAALPAPVLATPVISDTLRRVFVASLDGTLMALDLNDGTEKWRYKAKGSVRHAPAVTATRLVLSDGSGRLVALDAHTGEVLWEQNHKTPFGTSPLIAGGFIYLGGLDRVLRIFDLDSGEQLWEMELKGRIRTTPMVVHDYLVVGSEDKYIYFFAEIAEAPSE